MHATSQNVDFQGILAAYSKSFVLRDYLASQLSSTRLKNVPTARMEVLYLNPEQGLLEQIAEVGFDTTLESMKIRPIPPVIEDSFGGIGICAYSAVRGESVLVPYIRFDTRYKPVLKQDSTQSELVVPVVLGDRTIGVLNLEADVPRAFGNQDLEYFESLSPVLALMIEYETYRHGEEFLKAAFTSISTLSDRDTILKNFLESVFNLIDASCTGCVLVPLPGNDNHSRMQVIESRGFPIQANETFEVGSSPVKMALESLHGHCYWSRDLGPNTYEPENDEVSSEFSVILRVGQTTMAALYARSQAYAISERYQQVIKRLADHVAALLFGLDQRGKSEREKAIESVLDTVQHEVHNAQSTWGFLLDNIREARVPEGTLHLAKSIQERLGRMHKMVSGFQKPPRPVQFRHVIDRIEIIARNLEVDLQCIGDFDFEVSGSEIGFVWLLENLVLNSRKHNKSESPVRTWIKIEQEAGRGVLKYWDNGQMPEPLNDSMIHKTGRKGLKLVEALCERYHWKFNRSKTENNAPLFEFRFDFL